MAPKVTLYGHKGAGPNPIKILIMLEELNIEYKLVPKVFGDGPDGVKAPDFLKINPNGRVPALIDHTNNDLIIWESGAILLYLAERFDTQHKLSATTLDERAEVWTWLMYQVSGLGPTQGQANWFIHYHSVRGKDLHPSVVERYQNETRRIWGVLEERLAKTGDWIVLGRFSIVDIANISWLNQANVSQVDMDGFPKLKAYAARINAFPSVKKAYARSNEA